MKQLFLYIIIFSPDALRPSKINTRQVFSVATLCQCSPFGETTERIGCCSAWVQMWTGETRVESVVGLLGCWPNIRDH